MNISSGKTHTYQRIAIVLGVLGILLIAAAIYWNTRHNEFVNMDDLDLIVRNRYVRSLRWQNIADIFTPGVAGAYQPVRTLSYAVDYHFWKLNPTGYHLTNIACHVGNILLVFLIAQVITQSGLAACLAALLFAVHPVNVEAVTWVSGRRDVLATCFVLFSFYSFLRFVKAAKRSGKSGWYALALLAGLLGLLTKASAMVLPFCLVLYDVCFLLSPDATSRNRWQGFWRRSLAYLPFFIITIGCMSIFLSVSRTAGVAKDTFHGGSADATMLTMIRVFAEYLSMLIAPQNLSLTYGIRVVNSLFEPSFLLAIVVLIGVGIVIGLAWKYSKIACFGLLWFFVALGPVSNIIIPIAIVKADRYLYLPSVGFWLAVAWGLWQGWNALRRFNSSPAAKNILLSGYWILIGLVIASYAWQTVARNRDWKNAETLWSATLDTHPDSPIALNNLGLIYARRGQYEQALALYGKLLDYHPNQHKVEQVYGNMGDAYLGLGLLDEAFEHYQLALETNPEYLNAYIGLAQVTIASGDHTRAEQIYQNALELYPQSDILYNQMGNLAFERGDYVKALERYQQALALNPYNIQAQNGLGLCYVQRGEFDQALAIFQHALQSEPDAPIIRNSLGTLYMEQGQTEQAIAEFQASLRQEPDNAEVRNNLGILLLRTQQYEAALKELMAAVKLQPDNPLAISNLGQAYTQVGLYEQAIQMYQWALELDPTLAQIQIRLGDLCVGMKNYPCAVDAYQKALELQPATPDIQDRLNTARQLNSPQP